jgi:UDP-GlcNAc:undecaprenyl-phosphate/decaprenyl-phosphate GlcNAc-1-phosphate transferase
MNSLVLTATATFAASLLLTAVVRGIARRWNIVDRPDGCRKLHPRSTPLWGGVAVYGAAVFGLLAIRFFAGATHEFVDLSTAWFLAAGFVCFVGGVDDRFTLPPRLKLVLQIVSVLPIVLLGHHVDRVVAFGCPIELGWLGVPLTILWLVGCINALNLIDGMDGLASIIGLATAVMLGLIAASEGHAHVAVMAMVLAVSLAGFLVYNLPPASIFLGDSGSMVIGLTIGLLGMQGSLKTSATLAITAPAVVMTLPMFDVTAAIVRRRLTGRRFDSPDRLHIHHRLLARGWNPWQVLCLLGALCLTTGAAATAASIFRRDALAWIAAMTLVVLMVRLRLFGHDEFALVKQVVVRAMQSVAASWRRGARRLRGGNAGLQMQSLNAAVAWASQPESPTSGSEFWEVLLHHLRAWNIQQVDFCSAPDGRPRRIRWIDARRPVGQCCRWSLSVSLPGCDGEIYELSAAAVAPITPQNDLAALTLLLTTFGQRLAADAERFLGSAVVPEAPAEPEQRRKAA